MTSTGQQIYEDRLAGEMWSKAIHKHNLGLMAGLLVAREYADANELNWPPNTGDQMRVDPSGRITGTSELAAMAKAIFATPEKMVAVEPKQRVPGRRGLALERITEGKGYKSYLERLMTGHSWGRIASRASQAMSEPYGGYQTDGKTASSSARRFAGTWGLPWPVGPHYVPPEDIDKRAESYRLRELSLPWEAIMILTGFQHKNSARQGAYYHSKKTGKLWPLTAPAFKLLPAAPTGGPAQLPVRISDQEDNTHGA
jgi:hypothetical protein